MAKTTDKKVVKSGDKVVVHYVGSFPDGEQFDNSYNRGVPVEVEVGNGTLIKGFDNALVGMSVGQKRTVSIVKEEAYGDVNPAAIIRVSKETFPNDFPFEKTGTIVPLKNDDGDELFGRLDAVEGDEVVVNLNHPMAGKDLQFEIELIGITKGPGGVATDTETETTTTTTTETKTTKKKTKAKKTKASKATKTDAE